eukprot:TRINITY_DN7857_c0_g1_i2.p1 TRINITY_DN7857_c0_g1~~TRINITY_DN7857_c0_g1_i2.p1  ORF type:complete len:227 (+),score=34.46 TRINITY_DN7857_c0_g1_i2:519-1199(+)
MDVGHMLEHISKKYAGTPILVIGCSIGTGHFTLWAGSNPDKLSTLNIVGGIMICHGLSAKETAEAVDASLFAGHILRCFRHQLDTSPPSPDLMTAELQEALEAASTLEEWDKAVGPVYGFNDREEMLRACDTTPAVLGRISVPMVFLNADDDPVTPAGRLIDVGRIHELVPNCVAARTAKGSHMGWWEGAPWALSQDWASQVVSELVVSMCNLNPTSNFDNLVASY